jgi:alkaline phosphatase
MTMNRRDWLRTSALASAGGVFVTGEGYAQPAASARRTTRNIIFFVYDGLSWEDVALVQAFARRRAGRPLVLHGLLRGSPSGSQETYSLSSVVTDSSAAASAWGTGRKHINHMVNEYPDGQRLTTIFDVARAQGRATGLVSTARITHATPAGFVARVANRDHEDDIAAQYHAFGVNVLLGGGARHFLAERRGDGRDMLGAFAGAGYDVLRTTSQLERSSGSKLLGVFADAHMPFEIDRTPDAVAPTLSQMTRKALTVLEGAARGFVLQVEAGRVDHANHRNDAAAMLHEVLAADHALGVVLEFVATHPDTLLIMAVDHATGGGCVYGTGRRYNESSQRLSLLDAHTASFDGMLARMGREPTVATVQEVVRAAAGVRLTEAQARHVADAIGGARHGPNTLAYREQPHNALGWVIHGGGDPQAAGLANVSYATGQHTAAAVPIAVHGAGATAIDVGFNDNTEPFEWMTRALGERIENPVFRDYESMRHEASAGSLPTPVAHG